MLGRSCSSPSVSLSMQPDQIDLFRSQAVYRWPAIGPGVMTHQTQDRYWRARVAPVLACRWVEVPATAELDRRLVRVWRHPSPLTRAENEVREMVAASINLSTLGWWVSWPVLVGSVGGSWSRGRSESVEAAQDDAMKQLLRRAGYHCAV